MTVTLVDREKILRELKKMSCGKKADLVLNLQNVDILSEKTNDICEELGQVGVVRHGYDGLGELRFKLTDFGNDYCDSYLSLHDTKQRLSNLLTKLNID